MLTVPHKLSPCPFAKLEISYLLARGYSSTTFRAQWMSPSRDEIPVTEKFISNPSPDIEVQNDAPVMDEPEIQNMPTERNLRRSSRTNKGVPPARYGEQ
ncbi:unnamed protein product [Clavelina lepadiformis]|uniref:Uncharacterized protein n=1 Tax=Clavelina lepadiformis TaxID=159417 RepID=A0ABP0G5W2_CLALP